MPTYKSIYKLSFPYNCVADRGPNWESNLRFKREDRNEPLNITLIWDINKKKFCQQRV